MKTKKLTAWISAAALASAMITPITVTHAEGTTTLAVGTDKEYTTIRAAVAAAKEINPQSETDRVTIDVDPGTYEEQVRFDGMKYITLEQTPGTTGKVNLSFYYCTGYCAADADLSGSYNENIDWYANPPVDSSGKSYEIGEVIPAGTTLTYNDKSGASHTETVKNATHLGSGTSLDKMAPLIVTSSCTDITIKDLNVVNSIPVMVTAGEKAAHVTPELDRVTGVASSYDLPRRDALSICDESTAPSAPTDVLNGNGEVDKTLYMEKSEEGRIFTAAESAFLARSSGFNERGHAISINGDRIILENIRARGNQDSVYVSNGRIYFKNCDLIGGTDYIYGNAACVFDGCLLGAEGMTDKQYGATITAANTDSNNPYGYLFYNCTLYNMLENIGDSCYGRPWGSEAQITFFNTKLDDTAEIGASAAGISSEGWRDMSSSKKEEARFFEYGTYNASGTAVDYSGRVVNASAADGGEGMGTVLDKWQILEFNPRNYFAERTMAANHKFEGDWDPMDFASTYLTQIDKEIEASSITVPAGEETVVSLPEPSDSGIEFHWVSSSSNAVVSSDEKTLTVVRPAAGEAAIESSVILYARDTETGFGDKQVIPVTINPTTDTTNVFNIPVTIEQSTSADNTYTVTVTKDGALIKSQGIAVTGTAGEATLANIPATAEGIDYDVTIVSSSNDFTVTVPADGKTTVQGITGKDVTLALTATKLVDETIDVDISTTAADGNKTYDLIALAKANGANSSISSSDVISVEMDVNVASALSSASFIDISSGTPSNSNGAVAQRFTIFKLNNSWTQIDTVDNTQGFSGSSNSEHQYLNITGKFDDYSTVHHIKATIDYKAGTVTIDGSNSGSYKSETPFTFGSFPESAQKGTLNMGVFIGSTSDSLTISNVQVTYKKIVSDTEEEPVEKEAKTITVTSDGTNNGATAENNNGTYTISGSGAYYFDLNAIANDEYFADSSYVTVKYAVKQDTQAWASVDLTASSPLSAYNSSDTTRIVTARFGQWNQINVFSGARTGAYKPDGSSYADAADQILNIDDKTAQSGNPTAEFRIDRDNKKITVTCWKSDGTQVKSADLTDCTLPSDFGKLYLAVYPNNSTITLSNITVTYDTAKSSEPVPEPTPIPDGEGIYVFRANGSEMTNGNQCKNSDEFTILDGADSMARTVFKSDADSTKVDPDYVGNYKNYISGTASNGTHPQITVTPAKAGKYDIYLIGYNHGDNVQALVGDKAYTAAAGVQFAAKTNDSGYVLKSYKIEEVELPAGKTTITFDSTDQWLPDTYAVAVVGTAEKPDYEGQDITNAEHYNDPEKGEFANAYETKIDYSKVNAPSLKWIVKMRADKDGVSTLGTADVDIDTVLQGDGTAIFGLILTGSEEELETVESVRLELQ